MDSLIEKNKEALLAQRYCFPIPQLMYAMKEGRMKWADGKKAKEILDAAILSLLGEKTEADLAAMAESKKKGKKEAKKEVKTDLPAVEKEKEGFEGRDMESSKNSAELIAEHQKITGGKEDSMPFPSGTERLSAHRSCKEHVSELQRRV